MIHIYVGIAPQVASLLVGLAIIPLHYHACLAIVEQSEPAIAPIRPVAVGIHLLVLADVVHLCIHGGAATVGEVRGEYLAHIALVRATAQVHVCHPLRLVLLLYRQVHHCGLVRVQFLAVFLFLVRLLVYLHVLHGIRGHIGQSCVHVAEERFAVHQYLVHHLALICHVAVLVYTYAWQLVHQCRQRSVRWQAQGGTAENQRILLHRHHARESRYTQFVQFLGGRFHTNVYRHRGTLCRQAHIAHKGSETHHPGHHDILPCHFGLEREVSLLVRGGNGHTHRVGAKQLHAHLWQGFLGVTLRNPSAHLIRLRPGTDTAYQQQEQDKSSTIHGY